MKKLNLKNMVMAVTAIAVIMTGFVSCGKSAPSKINKKIEDENILIGKWDADFRADFELLKDKNAISADYKLKTWTLSYEEVNNDWACKYELPGVKKGEPYMANILTLGKPEEDKLDGYVEIFIIDTTRLSPQLIPYKWSDNNTSEKFHSYPKEELSEYTLKKVKD